MEVWKDVVGFEGYYKISSLGNVKSLARTIQTVRGSRRLPERVLRPGKKAGGYLHVCLYSESKNLDVSVHTLVAEAFLDKGTFNEVNHKDEDKENNSVKNLEWCNRKYNNSYGKRHLKHKEAMFNHKSMSHRIEQLSLEGVLIERYDSIREASRVTGFDNSGIAKVVRGEQKTCKGFLWRMVAEENV